MGKLPYVNDSELFLKLDHRHAEEIIGEFNDFYGFNMSQIHDIYFHAEIEEDDETEGVDEEKRLSIADKNAKAATDHFAGLFPSHEYGEGALVGFRPAYEDLQKILLEEYKNKTDIRDSVINGIAPRLRNIASIMAFASRIVGDLEFLCADTEQIANVKAGFKKLIERNERERLDLPMYTKTKDTFKKYKKAEQYIAFAEKLFDNA